MLLSCVLGQSRLQVESSQIDTASASFSPNPTVAALLSTALPGAGQVYAKSFWHAPLFAAAEAFCAYKAYKAWVKADEYWRKRASLEPGSEEFEQVGEKFESATEERDQYLWLLGAAKFLDIVDAYVCAQMFDFDEKANAVVSLSISPSQVEVKLAFTLRP